MYRGKSKGSDAGRGLSVDFVQRESSDLEGTRDLYPGGDGVHGVGLWTVCREAPDSAAAQIDYDFTENLPAVVGGAEHMNSWLDKETGAGGLRLDGLRGFNWADDDCEEQEGDDCQEGVRGGDWLHVDVLC